MIQFIFQLTSLKWLEFSMLQSETWMSYSSREAAHRGSQILDKDSFLRNHL